MKAEPLGNFLFYFLHICNILFCSCTLQAIFDVRSTSYCWRLACLLHRQLTLTCHFACFFLGTMEKQLLDRPSVDSQTMALMKNMIQIGFDQTDLDCQAFHGFHCCCRGSLPGWFPWF